MLPSGRKATLDGLWAFNAEIFEAGVDADFYFDPHTKHYTGEQNVLKGWCSKLRWADKVLQSDSIHPAGGAPLYFETTDSFEDMRERLFGVIARVRATLKWPAQREVSYVVDRGFFGAEVFAKILADPSHQRPVTGPGEGSTDQERPTQGVGQTSAESAWATGATVVGSKRPTTMFATITTTFASSVTRLELLVRHTWSRQKHSIHHEECTVD